MGLNLRELLPYSLKSRQERLSYLRTQIVQLKEDLDRVEDAFIADIVEIYSMPSPSRAAIYGRKVQFSYDLAERKRNATKLVARLSKEMALVHEAKVEIVRKSTDFIYHMP